MAIRLHFWGAAQTVTGSSHHIECAGRNVLLDCGPFQGRRMEAVDINSHLALSADQIAGGSDVGLSAVVLSHAHIDHSGNLPSLTHAARPRAGATALLAGGCRAGKSSVPTSNAV